MNSGNKKLILALLNLLVCLGLFAILTLLSSGLWYLIAGTVYCLIILVATSTIKKEHKWRFFHIVVFFLLFYSTYLIISHYVFIENPLNDYFVNVDESGFLSVADSLSKLSFSKIWITAFTDFKYSGTPLFFAWIGTVQKIIDLNLFHSLLFHKLNISFLGSFIPGIIYLLCRRVTDEKHAFKAALAYGAFSFVFFYSVGFMRDIHIALIYAIALYILTSDEYSLKNYVILILLGLAAYYLRFENGLFFISFFAIWIFKSGSKNKFLLSFTTILVLVGFVVSLGGIETIINMAISTIQGYSERAYEVAGQDSLGIQLKSLPIPINIISVSAFGQIAPFPIWFVFKDSISLLKNIFYLPEAVAAIFWFGVWMRIIRHPKKTAVFFKEYKFVVLTVLIYIFVVSMAQPGARRLMAVYPIIFMAYVYISNKITKPNELIYNTIVYSILLVIYFVLKQ